MSGTNNMIGYTIYNQVMWLKRLEKWRRQRFLTGEDQVIFSDSLGQ